MSFSFPKKPNFENIQHALDAARSLSNAGKDIVAENALRELANDILEHFPHNRKK
jgi:hypothetical protein